MGAWNWIKRSPNNSRRLSPSFRSNPLQQNIIYTNKNMLDINVVVHTFKSRLNGDHDVQRGQQQSAHLVHQFFFIFLFYYLKNMHSLPIISFESDMLGQTQTAEKSKYWKQNIRPGSFLSEIKQSKLANVEASKCCFFTSNTCCLNRNIYTLKNNNNKKKKNRKFFKLKNKIRKKDCRNS